MKLLLVHEVSVAQAAVCVAIAAAPSPAQAEPNRKSLREFIVSAPFVGLLLADK